MDTISIAILDTEHSIAKDLGKKGTASDFTLFNFKNEKGILVACEPTSYPEKLQPLLYCLALSDVVLLSTSKLDKFFGEMLVTAELSGKPGYVLGDDSQFRTITKGMAINSFKKIDPDPIAMKDLFQALELSKDHEKSRARVIIDSYFSVKSVGLVALGKVEVGKVEVHDQLTLLPQNKKVTVRSIQVQDHDVKECELGRLGMCMKGVELDDLVKGNILVADPGNYQVVDSLEGTCSISRFSKQGIAEGSQIFVAIGMQYVGAKALSSIAPGENKPLKLELEKKVVLGKGDRILLCNPNEVPRVIGVIVVI